MNVRTNHERLVTLSVGGSIAQPSLPGLPAEPYRLAADGTPFLLPSYGGIVYNVSVGDSAYGWAADCIHPGVSITYPNDNGNRGLNTFACVGNGAVVASGQARGARGVVTGKSGRFSEHVILHFPKAARREMAIGDRVVVRAEGVGMRFDDYPGVALKSLSPRLLEALALREEDGRLVVPVVAVVPPHLVGAGAGLTSEGGSIHIQTTDAEAVAGAGLDALRLGDIVALGDTDSRYQHGYLRGAVGIGVVGQTNGPRAGYGPGLTLLMTDASGALKPEAGGRANLAELLKLEA